MKRILVTNFYKNCLNCKLTTTVIGNKFGENKYIHTCKKQVSARTGFLTETFNSTRFQANSSTQNNPYVKAR